MAAPSPAAVRSAGAVGSSASAHAKALPPTERVAGPGWHAENRTILDSLAYARRLGVSRRLLQEALKVKLETSSTAAAVRGENLADRQCVRELADRMAYPTDWVHNRNPMPVWYVGDVERYERENGVGPETPTGRWVRRPRRLSGYSGEDIFRATGGCGLSGPERAVIVGRYGLDGSRPVSQAALADDLGVSERTVRTMEHRASEKAAAWLEERGVPRSAAGEGGAPPPCARCLTPKASYADEAAMLCSSCDGLYSRVHDEVCRERDALRAQAEKYGFYVGDCRPYRRAFMLNLPLYALNRLARVVEAEDRGYGYAASGALRAGELVYAGNMELLGETWHYGEKRLREGIEHLKRAGKIERRGVNPRDPRVEFWAVLAPYERPNLSVALRRGRRLIPR